MDTKESALRNELREKIIITASDAFKKNGIKSITMDDVATLLKISKRTLYEIFKDKEALLRECILFHQRHTQKMLEEIVNSSTNVLEIILKCYQKSVEMLHDTDKRYMEDIKKYPRVYKLMSNHRKQDNDAVTNFLKKGVEQGLFRDDINFEIIQMLLRKQFDMLKNSDVCDQYPFLEVYELIILTHLRGISTPKGAEKLESFIRDYRKKIHHPG